MRAPFSLKDEMGNGVLPRRYVRRRRRVLLPQLEKIKLGLRKFHPRKSDTFIEAKKSNQRMIPG